MEIPAFLLNEDGTAKNPNDQDVQKALIEHLHTSSKLTIFSVNVSFMEQIDLSSTKELVRREVPFSMDYFGNVKLIEKIQVEFVLYSQKGCCIKPEFIVSESTMNSWETAFEKFEAHPQFKDFKTTATLLFELKGYLLASFIQEKVSIDTRCWMDKDIVNYNLFTNRLLSKQLHEYADCFVRVFLKSKIPILESTISTVGDLKNSIQNL